MIAWGFPNDSFCKVRLILLTATCSFVMPLPATANGLRGPNAGLSLGMMFAELVGGFLLTGLITALLVRRKNQKPSFGARTAFWLVYFLAFVIAVVLDISFNHMFDGENSNFCYACLVISSLFICLIIPASIAAMVFRMITKPGPIRTK